MLNVTLQQIENYVKQILDLPIYSKIPVKEKKELQKLIRENYNVFLYLFYYLLG